MELDDVINYLLAEVDTGLPDLVGSGQVGSGFLMSIVYLCY